MYLHRVTYCNGRGLPTWDQNAGAATLSFTVLVSGNFPLAHLHALKARPPLVNTQKSFSLIAGLLRIN